MVHMKKCLNIKAFFLWSGCVICLLCVYIKTTSMSDEKKIVATVLLCKCKWSKSKCKNYTPATI